MKNNAGWDGHSHGTVVLSNVCIPAKEHAVRYCRRFAFREPRKNLL